MVPVKFEFNDAFEIADSFIDFRVFVGTRTGNFAPGSTQRAFRANIVFIQCAIQIDVETSGGEYNGIGGHRDGADEPKESKRIYYTWIIKKKYIKKSIGF